MVTVSTRQLFPTSMYLQSPEHRTLNVYLRVSTSEAVLSETAQFPVLRPNNLSGGTLQVLQMTY